VSRTAISIHPELFIVPILLFRIGLTVQNASVQALTTNQQFRTIPVFNIFVGVIFRASHPAQR
jgi:uncharacterized membrane protein